MSCEWMRVTPCNPPVCLTIPPAALPLTVNRKTEGLAESSGSRLCPSLITASGPMPSWAAQALRSTPPAGATLTTLPEHSAFEIWINYLNLSPVPRERSGASYATELRETCLEQMCPYEFLRSVSYLMSDIIVISSCSVEEATDQYKDWLRSCKKALMTLSACESVLRRYTKPFAVLNIVDHTSKGGSKDFLETVYIQNKTKFLDAKTIRALNEDVFQDTIVLNQSRDIKKEMLYLVSLVRQQRVTNRHLWSQCDFHTLHAYLVRHLANPRNQTIYFVEALSPLLPIQSAQQQLWPELLNKADTAKDMENFVLPLLSRNIGRYFLRCSHVFHPDEIFALIYEDTCACTLGELLNDNRSRHIFQQGITESMEDCKEDVLHHLSLYGRYWDSIVPRELCFACLIYSYQFYLPCGHAVCQACLSLLPAERSENITGDQCPFCLRVLGFWRSRSATENDQSGPDGGFKIGATILRYHNLFMAVVDIGLKLRAWGSKDWTQNLTSTVLPLLYRPDSWLDLKGGWAPTWRNIFKIVGRKNPYQRDALRDALRQAFEIDITHYRPCSNPQADSGISGMAWQLLASIFSFEFVYRPRRSRGALVCVGRLKCHHSDHYLFPYLRKGMESQVRVYVGTTWVPFQWPCVVKFRLPDLFQPFDVRIVYGGLTASLAGFPRNAYKISIGMGEGVPSNNTKRRLVESDDHAFVKRPRIQEL